MEFEKYRNNSGRGFTIIELLVVIVVIGILATIVLVSYNGVADDARDATMQVDVDGAAMLLEKYEAKTHTYPQDPKLANDGKDLPSSSGNTIAYRVSDSSRDYCVSVTDGNVTYHRSSVDGNKTLVGDCSGITFPVYIINGSFIQTITTANCPTTRIRAVDARDNHTYWVQKLADGKCWMLTNLAYAGSTSNGGANTYSDVIPTGDGSAGTINGPDNAGSNIYTLAKYYIPTNANPTTEPTNPSTSTDGGATNPQYGYFYNWCAAMGSQATAACSSSSTPAPIASTSICPKNWRLPTGNGGEFGALNTAINSGSTTSDSGLRSTWLAQYGGYWNPGFVSQGTQGIFWSSTQRSATYVYRLTLLSGSVSPTDNIKQFVGLAVRCVAAV